MDTLNSILPFYVHTLNDIHIPRPPEQRTRDHVDAEQQGDYQNVSIYTPQFTFENNLQRGLTHFKLYFPNYYESFWIVIFKPYILKFWKNLKKVILLPSTLHVLNYIILANGTYFQENKNKKREKHRVKKVSLKNKYSNMSDPKTLKINRIKVFFFLLQKGQKLN